ncbi:NAD(P)H-dependent oxidoreductase [Candidatus Woesearchaeota archaeon]|nr:NAD(P)H-dependent oxidoreductase [Candidatus Woesearchaeota archaeon]
MQFGNVIRKRYACKKFADRRIPENKVDELVDSVRLAPSSFGLQTWQIKIVTDKKTKEKLFPVSYCQEQITTCSHLLVFCADTRVAQRIDRYENLMKETGMPQKKIKQYIGTMRDWAQSLSEEQFLVWCQKQAYIAMTYALLGATALGFASCPMEGFLSKEYSKILELPSYLVPTVLVPIGYVKDKQGPRIRFDKEELLVQ